MFVTLVEKELKNALLSPKFVATFAACTVLILISILAGIIEYRSGSAQYAAATALVNQELSEASSWNQVGNRQRVYRQPQPMHIFSTGVHFDIGRFSTVSAWQDVRLQQSAYSIDPVFAVFRAIDFVFIVQVVLSLLTIVFAYDLVSGEKESGTLRLLFANAVPRPQYLAAKVVGAWLALMIPLLIPLALGVLLLLLSGIPFDGYWGDLARLTGYSALYLTAFLCLGALFSTLTHRSSMSFLLLLVFWIAMVLVVPRGGMMIASSVHPLPSASELESRKGGFARERREAYFRTLAETHSARMQAQDGMSEEERTRYRNDNEWEWTTADDALRNGMEADIADYNRRVDEEANNARMVQQRLGFSLSRLSPASAFQLAAMRLAHTDLGMKQRFIDALHTYRTTFLAYLETKNPGGGMRFSTSQQAAAPLDLSDAPRFSQDAGRPEEGTFPVDLAVLVLYIAGSLSLALVVFNRYDVR